MADKLANMGGGAMVLVRDNALMTTPAGVTPVDAHTSNASVSGVVTLTPPSAAVVGILIQCTGQNIRLTIGGTAPTTTLGFRIKADDPAVLVSLGAGVTVKVIEETATATVQYQWVS